MVFLTLYVKNRQLKYVCMREYRLLVLTVY